MIYFISIIYNYNLIKFTLYFYILKINLINYNNVIKIIIFVNNLIKITFIF